ncbi:MAG: polymer-forming cytoskeletal protein [Thermodesulfovibrionales bacterium]|nr:polymer-forming cytoskeletal protein [Thermodesulfovibrionales bacterium]
MFTKKQQGVETIIGPDTTFKGELNSKSTVRIDGNFEGIVNADWIIIGEAGRVKGEINCRGIVIGGRAEGNIKSTETIEIKHKAQVFGEICTQKLSISEGAIFDGRSCMQERKPDVKGHKSENK